MSQAQRQIDILERIVAKLSKIILEHEKRIKKLEKKNNGKKN